MPDISEILKSELLKPMTRFIKKSIDEIGASPDELIFRGVPKIDQVKLRLIDYDGMENLEPIINSIEEVVPYVDKESVTWLNIDGLHDTSIMEAISNLLGFEQLMLAQVMNTTARPTITEYDSGLFISIKMLRLDSTSNKIYAENLSLILKETILISFQEIEGDVFEPVRERIRRQKKRITGSGTDYLAYALLDVIIDNYTLVLSLLGEKIEELEDHILSEQNAKTIHKIDVYKRELNYLRRNIKPAKEMISTLLKVDSDLIEFGTDIYLLELQNNINHADEISDSYREILSDQLNIYHTTMSSKLNDIMKFLTVFSVIFIPLTFIAGIYGTNFKFLPELEYKYSYFIMLGFMVLISTGMLIYFKRNKWL